jgi:hypothetical protein
MVPAEAALVLALALATSTFRRYRTTVFCGVNPVSGKLHPDPSLSSVRKAKASNAGYGQSRNTERAGFLVPPVPFPAFGRRISLNPDMPASVPYDDSTGIRNE